MKVSDLSGLLGKFDPSYKDIFNQRINENGRAKITYDSVLVNRNNVAHGRGTSATFEDVKMYYEKGHVVLDYFRQALHAD